jgi:hypothetical protein
MKDYIFLDTNIWVYCCLASQENFDHSALVKIKKALDNDKFLLLVPQTVEAELNARLDEHLKTLRTKLHEAAGKLLFLDAYPTYRKKIQEELEHLIKEANDNFAKSKKEIDGIFSHKNTVKLKLSGDILVAAHLRCLSRKRPFRITKSKYSEEELAASRITDIQNDAVIVEELKSYLSDTKDYKLYIANWDGDYIDSQTGKLHEDIVGDFLNAELFTDLQQLLKLFKVQVPQKEKAAEDALKTLSSLTTENLLSDAWQVVNQAQYELQTSRLNNPLAGIDLTMPKVDYSALTTMGEMAKDIATGVYPLVDSSLAVYKDLKSASSFAATQIQSVQSSISNISLLTDLATGRPPAMPQTIEDNLRITPIKKPPPDIMPGQAPQIKTRLSDDNTTPPATPAHPTPPPDAPDSPSNPTVGV